MITFKEVLENQEIKKFIEAAGETLNTLGYTDHGFVHAMYTAETAGNILRELGEDAYVVELGLIAGYMHDIGNAVARNEHEQIGAILSYNILTRLGMPQEDLLIIMNAIGNHDEHNGTIANKVAAAVVIADKSDIHRGRVSKTTPPRGEEHYFVNYATTNNCLCVDKKERIITLQLEIDDTTSPMEMLSLYSKRFLFCESAAKFLVCQFRIVINGVALNQLNTTRQTIFNALKTSKNVSGNRL